MTIQVVFKKVDPVVGCHFMFGVCLLAFEPTLLLLLAFAKLSCPLI